MNNNNNSGKVKSLLLYLGIPIVIILIMTLVLSQGQKDSHTYSEIVGYFHDDKVQAFEVERSSSSAKIKLTLDDNTVITHKIMDWDTFRDDVWADIEAHNQLLDRADPHRDTGARAGGVLVLCHAPHGRRHGRPRDEFRQSEVQESG